MVANSNEGESGGGGGGTKQEQKNEQASQMGSLERISRITHRQIQIQIHRQIEIHRQIKKPESSPSVPVLIRTSGISQPG